MYIYQQTEKPSFASLLPLLALAPLALLALSTLFSTAIPTVTTTGRKKRSVLLRSNGTEDDQDLAEALEGLILGHTDLELEDVRSQAVASMLSKINIKVDLQTMPKAQYWPKFDERAADIMMIGWHSDTEDSANFNEFLTMTPNADTGRGQYNSGNYSNEKVDELTMASLTETKGDARAEQLQMVEKILFDEAAFVPLHWQDLAWAARKGVDIEPVLNVMNFPYLGDLVISE